MVVVETIVEERPGGLPVVELLDTLGNVYAACIAEVNPYNPAELSFELEAKHAGSVHACRYVVDGVAHITRLSSTAMMHPNDTLRVALTVTDHMGDPIDIAEFGVTTHIESRIV